MKIRKGEEIDIKIIHFDIYIIVMVIFNGNNNHNNKSARFVLILYNAICEMNRDSTTNNRAN